jgi:hypothetical protein
MWVAIGIIGAATLINISQTAFMVLRVREVELFLIVMSGAITGSNDELAAYLKSRGNHPAGKKKVDE